MVDLHVHSVFSDGTLTPAELISLAQENGVSAVALCDHNTVAGLPSFLAAAKGSGVKAVPGVEFSTEYRGKELHILGLFIRHEHYGAVTALLDEMLERKERSSIDLCEALGREGIVLDYAAIKAGTPDGYVNRAVIGAEMVRLGVCGSVQEAFSQWLDPARGYYQPPKRPDSVEVIRFIKSIGSIAVLAHPFLALDAAELREFLKEAVPAGLDGMETMYPLFDEATTRLAEKIVGEFGLLPSGGSDFHGANKPDICLGSGRGDMSVPETVLQNLENRWKKKENPTKYSIKSAVFVENCGES